MSSAYTFQFINYSEVKFYENDLTSDSIQTLTCLPTRQNGVGNRDKVYSQILWSYIFVILTGDPIISPIVRCSSQRCQWIFVTSSIAYRKFVIVKLKENFFNLHTVREWFHLNTERAYKRALSSILMACILNSRVRVTLVKLDET